MRFAAIPVLVMLASACRAQQPVPIESSAMTPPAISLFVSCDLAEEFIAPGMDAREVLWLGTPVSRAGARLLEESRRQCVVSQVPLVFELDAANRMDAIVAPLELQSGTGQGRIRLLTSKKNDFHPAASAPHARAVRSTWVRIRGYGR